MSEKIEFTDEDDYIHNWFGLTYANYLVLPRSILQSMDAEWQKKLVILLDEMEDKMREECLQDMPDYSVNAINSNGKYIKDPYRYYWRNNNRINGLVDVFGIDRKQFEKDLLK